MDKWLILQRLGIAVALGLVIGLQRQRVPDTFAGARTFPLIAALGTFAALLAELYGQWIILAGLVAVAALIVTANVRYFSNGGKDHGITTEIAALLMFCLGAYLLRGDIAVAVIATGGMAVLLHFKEQIHRFVQRIGEKDATAIMQFVLIALVILPALPNQDFGPFKTLNPFEIWMMVVLIVGIGLAGYAAYKIVGERVGTLLAGVIGGAISSTATTASYSRKAAGASSAVGPATLVVLIACAIAVVRVMIEVIVVAPGHFQKMIPPIAAVFVTMAVIACAYYFFFHRHDGGKMPEQKNPAQLKGALIFAALYAVIKLGVAAAKHYLGEGSLYPVAAISGMTDSDAITLSTASLVQGGQITPVLGTRLIMVALIANLVFKAGMVAVLAGMAMTVRLGVAFGIAIAAGTAILFLWPGL
jgi:uncharacterized membrane protein (DUF4010 family)